MKRRKSFLIRCSIQVESTYSMMETKQIKTMLTTLSKALLKVGSSLDHSSIFRLRPSKMKLSPSHRVSTALQILGKGARRAVSQSVLPEVRTAKMKSRFRLSPPTLTSLLPGLQMQIKPAYLLIKRMKQLSNSSQTNKHQNLRKTATVSMRWKRMNMFLTCLKK